MQYLKQFLIIIAISFCGEFLNHFIPLPIPASIYGMGIMLLGLTTRLIKLESVRDASKFLISVMPCMFIPAGVGLMTKWDILKSFLIPIVVTIIVTTVIVMAVTGLTAQGIIRHDKKKTTNESEVKSNG